jgi:hypothetical protein
MEELRDGARIHTLEYISTQTIASRHQYQKSGVTSMFQYLTPKNPTTRTSYDTYKPIQNNRIKPRHIRRICDRSVWRIVLSTFWALSIANQISGNYSDPKHPSDPPWYVVYRCGGLPRPEYGCCMLARAFLWFSGNLL